MGEINVRSAIEILDEGTLQKGVERYHFETRDFGKFVKIKVLKASEARSKDLVKGRALPEGTIRTFAGKKFKKTAGKWLPYSEGKKKKVVDKADRERKTEVQVPKGERAQPKTIDEAKDQARKMVARVGEGGKLRAADRVTEEAKRQGVVDGAGKVTKKGETWATEKKKVDVKKPSQIKKRKKQVKDTRNTTQVTSDAVNAVMQGKKIYEHKLTRDQKRSYDRMVIAKHAEWKTDFGSSNKYLDIAPLGYVQNTINGLSTRLANDPTDEAAREELLSMSDRRMQIQTKDDLAALVLAGEDAEIKKVSSYLGVKEDDGRLSTDPQKILAKMEGAIERGRLSQARHMIDKAYSKKLRGGAGTTSPIF